MFFRHSYQGDALPQLHIRSLIGMELCCHE